MILVELDEFKLLTGYAKAVASQSGEKLLQTKHYLAAAVIANQRGLLVGNQTVDAHIRAHLGSIKALLNSEQIVDLENIEKPALEEKKVSLDESVKSILAKAALKKGTLLDFVDALFEMSTESVELESVAYHEAGHAVVSLLLRPEFRIDKVTIEQNGGAAGCVSFVERKSRYNQEFFLEHLCVAISGQLAQIRQFGENSADAGAISDFTNATQLAWDYISRFGLDPEFGPVILDALKEKGVQSGWLFDEAQRRLQSVLKEAQSKTAVIVDTHWEKIRSVALLLLEKKTITEEEIRKVVSI